MKRELCINDDWDIALVGDDGKIYFVEGVSLYPIVETTLRDVLTVPICVNEYSVKMDEMTNEIRKVFLKYNGKYYTFTRWRG